MSKGSSRPMSPKDASRIQRVGDRQPTSKTATSDFAPRAQRAAAHQAKTTTKK